MMLRVRGVLILLMLVLAILTACVPEASDLPTQMVLPPDAETEVTATEAVEPTLAPTITPFVRPTLPPTFTPTTSPSETPTPTDIPVTPAVFVPPATLPEACSTFAPLLQESDREFVIGTAPRVTWTAVEGAELYRLVLQRDDGLIVKDDIYLAETFFVFDAGFFTLGRFYGWLVYPINARGDQMCFAVGAELTPYRPLGQ